MNTVAVVGLGAMGSRLATRLLDAGHDVVVWNRDPTKAVQLAKRGAATSQSPAEAARRAELVLTMVSDPPALRDVAHGPDGVLAGITAPATLAQMSTVSPESVQELASALPAGVGLLDAPVLGSVTEVEAGTLSLFVGGDEALVERWTPLLSALGSVTHVGPVGAGTAAKLVANSTLFGVLGLLGEALALGDALGLSREVSFSVLAATPLAAQAERRRASIESGEFPARFALSLASKDAKLIVEAAASSGADLRLAGAARAWLADAEESGARGADYSTVLAHIIRSRRRGTD